MEFFNNDIVIVIFAIFGLLELYLTMRDKRKAKALNKKRG